MRSPLLTILAALLTGMAADLLLPKQARAQEAPPRGAVTGHVLDRTTGRPVPDATVRIVELDRRSRSNTEGTFALTDVPVGIYALEVEAIGYAPFTRSGVVVGSGKPYVVDVALDPRPILLEGIEVGSSFFRRSTELRPSTRALDTEETRRTPGGFEDVVRAVALLPGVGVAEPGRNDLVVRGGAPFENLFLIDGIQVANINHFGSQGSTGGPLSVFNADFVREVTFSSGGFGVRHGDRTSSFTDIALRDGSEEELSTELNLAATGFGAMLEGPVGSGSFLLGVRRSYLDFIFEAAGQAFVPQYWDLTLKATQRPGPRDRLSFLAIGALDRVSFNNDTQDKRFDNRTILSPSLDQVTVGATWTRFLNRGAFTAALSKSRIRFESVQRDTLLQEIFRNESVEGETSLRLDLDLAMTPAVDFLVGNTLTWADELEYDVVVDDGPSLGQGGVFNPLSVDTTFRAARNGTYLQVGWRATDALRAEVGARSDWYGLVDAWRGSLRASLSLEVGGSTTVNLAAGRYYQPPSYIWIVGDPTNAENLEPFYADQVVGGVVRRLRNDVKLQVEGYYKRYGDYPARVLVPAAVLAPSSYEDATTDAPFGLEPLTSQGKGEAYGAEVFLQKRLSDTPWYGLASLSLGRSRFAGLDGVYRPGAYDARVIATLLGGIRLGPVWELSGKVRVSSGRPTTPFVTSGPRAGTRDASRYHAERLPAFHALDVRVDRRWSFSSWQLEAYIDIQNLYGRENVTGYTWDPRLGEATSDGGLTVLPSIGVNVEF